MDLIIYGAQGVALGIYEAIHELYPRREIKCFMVTKMGNNAPMLGGLPVVELAAFAKSLTEEEKDNLEILIGTPENVHIDIEESLETYGFRNHKRITSKRFAEMMCMFHARKGLFTPLKALPVGCTEPFLRIYVAKSHKDQRLRGGCQFPGYMVPLQVGASLSDKKIADRQDNTGINISQKNGNYSELTGLYWLWKNKLESRGESAEGQYYGFMQYRRILEIAADDIGRMVSNDIDVILPYPMPYEPDIEVHHERYLRAEDWQALLDALSEVHPEYAQYFPTVLSQRYFYNYNIILAKKQILSDYCSWLFPVLERTEELSVPKGKDRCDRYIGYMGEVLETLYFMKNRSHFNIVHTMCKFLT